MRYNHRYHARAKGSIRHKRLRLTSFVIILALIVGLALSVRQGLDMFELTIGFLLTLYRVALGYIMSLILAVLLALLATRSARSENFLLPVLDVAQSFPTFAVLPILVFHFGKSSLSVAFILVIAMVWPITFSIISAIKEQHRDQAEAAIIFGAVGWRNYWYYRLPMLAPAMVTGSVVSWGQAWDTVVGAEIIAGVVGAGHYLGTLGSTGQTGALLLGIAVYLMAIFLMNQLFWLPLLHRLNQFQTES